MAGESKLHTRPLETLERLLEIPLGDLHATLVHACNLVAGALHADKVDAFFHDVSRDSLIALGSSTQPLSALQKRLGLDFLPIANGGRVVWVFQNNKTYATGHLEKDLEELVGVREALKLRSQIGVPLEVDGKLRGTVMIAALKPDCFTAGDVRFAESVARWVGAVAHRVELMDALARSAVEQGRRAAAEELVTVVAHDLRNFITPLHARTTMMLNRARADSRENDIADAGAALHSLRRMQRIIRDLLDVARIDRGLLTADPRQIDLGDVTADVAKAMSAPGHEVAVRAAEPTVVNADPDRIKQCLENVIANAQQHSPRGAAVTVLVSRHRTEEGEWGRIEVHDVGPGIPTEILPRIFERYTTGRSGGLGLGLYLARRIAVAHGGELSVDSAPGQGTHFVLTVPCDHVAA